MPYWIFCICLLWEEWFILPLPLLYTFILVWRVWIEQGQTNQHKCKWRWKHKELGCGIQLFSIFFMQMQEFFLFCFLAVADYYLFLFCISVSTRTLQSAFSPLQMRKILFSFYCMYFHLLRFFCVSYSFIAKFPFSGN